MRVAENLVVQFTEFPVPVAEVAVRLDPSVEALNASAVQEEVFRSYQGVSEDPEEVPLLASLNPAANPSKDRCWVGSNSQLSCALPGESRRADLYRRRLPIQHRTKKPRPEQKRIAVLWLPAKR